MGPALDCWNLERLLQTDRSLVYAVVNLKACDRLCLTTDFNYQALSENMALMPKCIKSNQIVLPLHVDHDLKGFVTPVLSLYLELLEC